MFLMPVIPFLTDDVDHMKEALVRAQEAGVDFVIFGGMPLKEGKQMDHFYDLLARSYPQLIGLYREIYTGNKWGSATKAYCERIHRRFSAIARRMQVPVRIRPHLYQDILDENDLVVVILEHIDYLQRLEGKSSLFGYEAQSLSTLQKPLSAVRHELGTIRGVSGRVVEVVTEILDIGSSSLYQDLICGRNS